MKCHRKRSNHREAEGLEIRHVETEGGINDSRNPAVVVIPQIASDIVTMELD